MKGAVVVAGGFSTRFGDADKAVTDVAGTPMIRRTVSAIAPIVDEVVINARGAQRDDIETALDDVLEDYRFAFDDVPDRGPLAGMVEGLETTTAEYTLVLACDMPFVDPSFVDTLFELASGADAAVPIERYGTEEWLQPLQAVYETESSLSVMEAALEEGITSPATAVGRLDYQTLAIEQAADGTDAWTLRNVNTPDDLREAERYFAQGIARER